MELTAEEQAMLAGGEGRATQKAMEILVALGTIYGAERLVPVTSVQVAGVSYDNLGEAGLSFLAEMADGGGRARVLTTLNPAGMDVENWPGLGIEAGFAERQTRVLEAFARMGVVTTCTCTPYLAGNLPHFGEHIAWSESSAVCFANSVLGARTNREGGPSALAAALTGRTPAYGYHLDEERQPTVTVRVRARLEGSRDFGALGKAIGERLAAGGARPVPFIVGVERASLEELKSFCASIATYGGTALFHMAGITPEAAGMAAPEAMVEVTPADVEAAAQSLSDAAPDEVDFVSLGCPHLSIAEIARVAELLEGRRVTKAFWITTSRPTKKIADLMGYTRVIEASGAQFATDTCCVVAPIRGRFTAMATDSAKACYYAAAKNRFRTLFLPFDEVIEEALFNDQCSMTNDQCSTFDVRRSTFDVRRSTSDVRRSTSDVQSPTSNLQLPTSNLQPPTSILHGRTIHRGRVEGEALVTSVGISFFGGVDAESGVVVERGHELEGQSVAGKVLVFPTGKGSTVGSYTLYRMKRAGVAPLAIVNAECEPITAVGCIIAEIPCVDHIAIGQLRSGDRVAVDGERGTVEVMFRLRIS